MLLRSSSRFCMGRERQVFLGMWEGHRHTCCSVSEQKSQRNSLLLRSAGNTDKIASWKLRKSRHAFMVIAKLLWGGRVADRGTKLRVTDPTPTVH